MPRTLSESVLRAAALVGLGVSALLIAEYQQPVPAFCAPGGGCEVVRHSPYAQFLGIPLPYLGVLFFAAVLGAAIVPRARRWLLPLGAAGAAAGVAFLGIQAFLLNAFCQFCLVVDSSALVIGGASLNLRASPLMRPTRAATVAHAVAAIAVVSGALAWHSSVAAHARQAVTTGELPPVVQRAQVPNLVTVVEFVDFECPACRAQHSEFRSVLASYMGKVNVVIKQVPLPQHEHAIDAARAFCCAEEYGEAREMADRLFAAEHLTPQDCEEIAVSLGLDRDVFRRCVSSTRVTERLRADGAAAASVEIHGLPTFWIGEERFEGVHESGVLRSSIDRALRRAHGTLTPSGA